MTFHILEIATWLLILIPLSIDGSLHPEIGGYTFRLGYVGIVCGLILLAKHLIQTRTFGTWLRQLIRSRYVHWVLAFLAVGVLSTILYSENQKRSVLWVLWAGGTLIGVPLVISLLYSKFPLWLLRSLAVYAPLQGLIAIVDQFLCKASLGRWPLGNSLYVTAEAGPYCRTYAFYQEPNYFAVFMLLAIVLFRLIQSTREDPRWKNLYLGSTILCIVGIFASTSRMGILGLLLLGAFEVLLALRKKVELSKRSVLVAIVLILGAVSIFDWGNLHTTFGGIFRRGLIAAFGDRAENMKASMAVAAESPWIGVGPGGAGAYLYSHLPQIPWFQALPDAAREAVRGAPLSYSLYGELFSEWGLLGSVFFFLIIFCIGRSASLEPRLRLWLILACVYITAQTLQRLDIWVLLSIFWAVARSKERTTSKFLALS